MYNIYIYIYIYTCIIYIYINIYIYTCIYKYNKILTKSIIKNNMIVIIIIYIYISVLLQNKYKLQTTKYDELGNDKEKMNIYI